MSGLNLISRISDLVDSSRARSHDLDAGTIIRYNLSLGRPDVGRQGKV
jgi:hypothetical protein